MKSCPWCLAPFTPEVRGGHTKKFCSAACKGQFESAARRYALAMVEAGLLSVDQMRKLISPKSD